MRPRRLLSIGHSYVVAGNRRLAHAVQRAAGRRWEVHVAAPDYFHGTRDLRPVALAAAHERYDWDVVGRQHLDFFDRLLDGPAATAEVNEVRAEPDRACRVPVAV